ncbi:ribonuclease HI [Chromatiales bacterium (ex Bugula neritina AB1)]|nr:ribonuclease HI [Chromatiales bacterium (ex Bugula neritina AB1)]
MAQQKYYVVWQGRTPGIYRDWPTCKSQVDGFAGARYKSFATQSEAEAAFATTPSKSTGRGKSSAGSRKEGAKRQTVKTYTAAEIAKMNIDTAIYTDGGCEPNPGEAGSGIAVYREGEVSELWYGLYNPRGTNNTAELNALFQALMMAQDEVASKRSVVIFCDSKYSIQCITQWAVNWEKKGWKKAGGEIRNLELIQEMFALYQELKKELQILHVNGHVGVEGNELADRMSIKAIAEHSVDFNRYSEAIDLDEILALRAG